MLNISNNIYSNSYSYNRQKNTSSPAFCGLHKLPVKGADEFISSKLHEYSPKNLAKRLITELLPIEDTQAKPLKLKKNLHDTIIDLTKKTSDAVGKDAVVYSLPEEKGLVLRVEKSALDKIDGLGKDLVAVPIKYDKQIAQNKHYGLPVYFIAERSSDIAKKKSLSPLEALSQPDKIMVLKKMSGEHPSHDYWENLTTLMGYDDFHPDINQLNNFQFLGYVRANFGNDAAIQCLENCKNGVTKFKPNQIAEGSPEFEFVNGETFYKNYKAFSDSYIKSLKDISEMPQESYNEAVENILAPKDFIMDFQHTNNTFVDLKNKEFNFMDFCFDKSQYPKYYYENPVKEFRNVLMGKCFAKGFKTPRALMIYPQDIEQVKLYSKSINEKVNIASPDKFKMKSPFS